MGNQSQQNNAVARYYSGKKRRKKRRKLVFYTLLTIFMVLIITVLSLTVFFNINKFTVEGNSHYSADEIISASGLETGQNMFRLNKFEIIESLKASLPYLSEVTIRRALPSCIQITVTESQPFAYLNSAGTFYIVDENLKILEADVVPRDDIPEIQGLELEQAQVGQTLTASDGAEQTLLILTQSMKANVDTENVTVINAENLHELSFVYEDRITVTLGGAESMDEKFKLIKYVIDENPSKEHAEINISSDLKAHYRSIIVEEEDENS